MRDDVIARLESRGEITQPLTADDDWTLNFLIDKVTNQIKNQCNADRIPGQLREIAVDMVCRRFLNEAGEVKSISEGDTAVTFAASGKEAQSEGAAIAAHRRVSW